VLEVIENLSRVHWQKLYRASVARARSPATTCPYSSTHLEIHFDRLN
jgi:hypothetical protein